MTLAVSVIIPARNAARTLDETLESIRAQTHTRWEAIVVDDGSTDGTAEVAAKFPALDSRFRVVTQPPGGVSAARNAGLAEARHEWLLFLDADDLIRPAYLQRMMERLAAEPSQEFNGLSWKVESPLISGQGASYKAVFDVVPV